MEQIKKILAVYRRVSTDVYLRDRSAKILQYGCQMLLGFYSQKFTEEVVEMIKLTKYTASTSRKVFWLFKSVNHFSSLINLVESYCFAKDVAFTQLLDIIEQFFLIVYFWYENLVLFARVKWVSFKEHDVELMCDATWFAGDLACFTSALLKAMLHVRTLYSRYLRLKKIDSTEASGQNSLLQCVWDYSVLTPKQHLSDELRLEISTQHVWLVDHAFQVIISLMEMGVSAHFIDAYKTIFGVGIGDGPAGFMGSASSLLIIVNGCRKAIRELN